MKKNKNEVFFGRFDLKKNDSNKDVKIVLSKSVSLTLADNKNAWYTRNINNVEQLVIPKAVLSTVDKDVHGDAMSQSFLEKAFKAVERILVNEEHLKDSDVGHVENIEVKDGQVVADIIVQNQDAIAKVMNGDYVALSIEGFAKAYKFLKDGTRQILDGVVNAIALTANPANKQAFFAKSDDESIPVAVEVVDADDEPVVEPTQAETDVFDTDVAPDQKQTQEPAADEPTPAEVVDVDVGALQVESIKTLEAELELAKQEIERVTNELTEANRKAQEQLKKSADAELKVVQDENYILKTSISIAKKAEQKYKDEIEALKKSLQEAQAKIEELEKQPLLKAGIHKTTVDDEISDEELEKYIVRDANGNFKKSTSIMKLFIQDFKK